MSFRVSGNFDSIQGNDKKIYTIDESVKDNKEGAIGGQRLRIEGNTIVADTWITKIWRTWVEGKSDYLTSSEITEKFSFKDMDINKSGSLRVDSFSEIALVKSLNYQGSTSLPKFHNSIKDALIKDCVPKDFEPNESVDKRLVDLFSRRISPQKPENGSDIGQIRKDLQTIEEEEKVSPEIVSYQTSFRNSSLRPKLNDYDEETLRHLLCKLESGTRMSDVQGLSKQELVARCLSTLRH